MTFLEQGKAEARERREALRPGFNFWLEKVLRTVITRTALFAWDTRTIWAYLIAWAWLRNLNPWAPLLLLLVLGLSVAARLKLKKAVPLPLVTDYARLSARHRRRVARKAGNKALRLIGLVPATDPTPHKAFLSHDHEKSIFTIEKPIPGLSFDRYEAKMEEFGSTFDSIRTVSTNQGKGCFSTVMHHKDPLEGLREVQLGEPTLAPVVGRKEDGTDLVLDYTDATHTAIQGMTRSGKSVFCYTSLSQVVGHPAVEVWGIDPNAVLLAPIAEATEPTRFALGVRDLSESLAVLLALVEEMDERIAQLRESGLDKMENFTAETPLILVILEEYPGLIRASETADRDLKPAERRTPKIKALVGRLVSESAKVGMRVTLITQRADAEILDGATRAQMGQRFTFGVDNPDAVRMLHPAATPETAERVQSFSNGRCLAYQHRAEATAQIDFISYEGFKTAVKKNTSQGETPHEPA